MKIAVALWAILFLVACGAPAPTPTPISLPEATLTPEATAVATSTWTPAPASLPPTATTARISTATPPSTLAARSTAVPTPAVVDAASRVDATTLNGKVIFGYQGWFSCPNDGSKLGVWFHWTKRSKTLNVADLTVDNWPDVSDLAAGERCATDMKFPNGTPVQVFSSYNPQTVDRHFQWMKQYGIDGVALQRFVSELTDARYFDFRNQVLRNVRASAEAHGRVFYVEYDVSGKDPATLVSSLKQDWAYLVDNLKIVSSPAYLHDNGLPVLEIYGLGLNSRAAITADLGQQIVDYFKSAAPPQYRVRLIGGVPSYWRTGTRDSAGGPAWAAVYRSFDVLSPWAVTRYKDNAGADQYLRDVISPDLVETAKTKARYMPVIFPGFSSDNLTKGGLNQIPRRCGSFYWHQAVNAVAAGSKMLFVAMFDEVDEGTAMFKLATSQSQIPGGAALVPLSADGCSLPSDWYLRLGGETGKLLRGEIPSTPEIPIKP